ncbi:VCBS repeat-containing protein, partial [bacterium]|nr:VCBS repeat-containing protein [bacterium]
MVSNVGGTFMATATLSPGGNRPDGITAGDFDNDGDMDIAYTADIFVSVYFNNAGTLAGPFNFSSGGQNSGPLMAADFDCDGDLDIVVGGGRALLQDADGGFEPVVLPGVAGEVELADWDGDGRLDVGWSYSGFDGDSLGIAFQHPDGGFPPEDVFELAPELSA